MFEDAIEVMARTMRIELDDITFDADFTLTTEDEDFGYMALPKGTIGATDARWRGWVGGRDAIVLRVQWVMGNHLESPVEMQHGYLVEIDGDPVVVAAPRTCSHRRTSTGSTRTRCRSG